MKLFPVILVFALVLALSIGVRAEDKLWVALQKRPDVTIETKDDGMRVATFESGVVMQELKKGKTLGVDNSGHGAVLCAWRVYSELEDWLAVCDPEGNAELKARVGEAVTRIEGFAMENSLSPALRKQTAKQMKEKAALLRKRIGALTVEEQQKHCTEGNVSKIIATMKDEPPGKFEAGIDGLLSVKRPAVMTPCL